MTEDDAIRMAHEIVREMGGVPDGTRMTPIVRALLRVAETECEACAEVCRHKAIEFANIANEESSEHYDNMERGAIDCELSIRARSNIE